MAGQGVALRFSGALRGLLADRLHHLSSADCAASIALRCLSSSAHDDGANIDFGFRQVPRDVKQGLVGQVFSSVASSYDVMNDLMSGGLHRLWKDRLVESLRPFPGQEHLDVAGGTGDVAFRVLRAIRAEEVAERMAAATAGRPSTSGRNSPRHPPPHSPPHSQQQPTDHATGPSSSSSSMGCPTSPGIAAAGSQAGPESSASSVAGGGGGGSPGGSLPGVLSPGRVVVCDINPDMLRVGQQKVAAEPDLAGESGLSFVEGNAEALPFPDASFDTYTIAFGIRNVTDRPAALAEALRVLKPGGRFMCLEFSHVTQPGLKEIYDLYSFAVIPRIGGLVANDAASYQYLVESIRKFPDQETFARMVEDAGFKAVTYENLTAGVVAIHSGFKL